MHPLGRLLIKVTIAILLPTVFAIPIFPNDQLECSPTTWADIFSFFLLNYVAHAATTPSPPGVNWLGAFQFPFISILYPFFGLGRTSSIIVNHASYGEDDLGKALSVGALAVAARTEDWKLPSECGEKLICESFPSQFLEDSGSTPINPFLRLTEVEEEEKESPTAVIVVASRGGLDIEGAYNIHGRHALPDGYSWVTLPPSSCFSLVEGLKDRDKNVISRSRSLLKMAISVIQLVLSSFTIYRTRGPQIARYGYASFGLSTIPYAFMSFLNLICIGSTGEYPYLFMLQTQTLEEASGRVGAEIAGAVGILAQETSQSSVSLWRENNGTLLCVKIGDSTRRFKLIDNTDDATFVFNVHGVKNRLRIYKSNEKQKRWLDEEKLSSPLDREFKRSSGFKGRNSISSLLKLEFAVVSKLLAYFLPYVLIFILTKFQKRQSTTFQRVVMMSWLAGGQSFSVVSPYFDIFPNFPIPSPRTSWRLLQKLRLHSYLNPNPDPPESRILAWGKVIVGVILMPVAVAYAAALIAVIFVSPFAGFVVVGKMLHEFDTCSLG